MSWKQRLFMTFGCLLIAVLAVASWRHWQADAQPAGPQKLEPRAVAPNSCPPDATKSVLAPLADSKTPKVDPAKPVVPEVPALDPGKPFTFDPTKTITPPPTSFDPSKPVTFDPTKSPPAFDPSKPITPKPLTPLPSTLDSSKPPSPPAYDPSKTATIEPIKPTTPPLPPVELLRDPRTPTATTAAPVVKTWDLSTYRCQGETSFAQVSQRLYGSEKYGRALLLFNRDCNPAAEKNLRGDSPRFEPGQALIYPPADILAAKYASAIGKADVETKPPPVSEFYWNLQLDSVGGKPRLTAKAKSKNITLQVTCDTLDLQCPRGKVVAQGNVKITATHLVASGEKLTINLHDDNILLEGQVEVKHKPSGQGLELKGDRLSMRVHALEPRVIEPTVNYEYEFVPRTPPPAMPDSPSSEEPKKDVPIPKAPQPYSPG